MFNSNPKEGFLKKHYSFISQTAFLTFLAAINLFVAFLYQWYIATAKGPGNETDALFAGMVIPTLVLAVVGGSLTFVLVPMLSTRKGNDLFSEAWNLFQLIGIVFVSIFIILSLTAKIWVGWTVPGFDHQTKYLTLSLVRIQLWGIIFTGLTGALHAVNIARERFIYVEIISIVCNALGFLLLIWGLNRFGISFAAWSMVFRMFLQTIILMPTLGRYRKPNWKDPLLKTAWKRIRPLLIGASYYRTDQLVDRILASLAPRGLLTFLHLSQQLHSSANTILAKAIVTPMMPVMSNLSNQKKWNELKKYVTKRLLLMTVITGFILIVLIIMGKFALSTIFAHRNFSRDDVGDLWIIMVALGGVLIAGSLGQILSSTFYAQGNTKIPTRIGIAGFSLGIGFKIGGFYLMGIPGLALGTSLYFILNAMLLYLCLKKNIQDSLAARQ